MSNMTFVFVGLVKDFPTAVITCGIRPNHSREDIVYQPHMPLVSYWLSKPHSQTLRFVIGEASCQGYEAAGWHSESLLWSLQQQLNTWFSKWIWMKILLRIITWHDWNWFVHHMSQVVLPLVDQYFKNHHLYFLSTALRPLSSGGHASNKEKEMVTR